VTRRSIYIQTSRMLLRLEKRRLERAMSQGWDAGMSCELDAVLVALEALSGERTEEKGAA